MFCLKVVRTDSGEVVYQGQAAGMSDGSLCGPLGEQYTLTMYDSGGDGELI
jgi:hypothetical protein